VEYYNYSTDLPFSKKILRFRELSSKDQIMLAKANLSLDNSKENYYEFNRFVIKIVKNCLEKPEDFDNINIIDYILFVTKLRIVSVGSIINLVSESKNKEFKSVKTQLDLNIFLKNLYNVCIEAMIDDIVKENNIEIKINWPSIGSIKFFQDLLLSNKSEYQLFAESFQEFIEYVKINDTLIPFINFTTEQKITITDKISISLLKQVKEKIIEALKFIMAYDLWEISAFKNYNFNFYTLNYTDSIRLFFSNDIKSLFQEIYYMAKEGLTPEYLLKLSPLERKIHFNIIEEIKRSQNNETSYDFEKINKTSSELEDLALEFGDKL
jgi:hypothetical protein